MDKVTTGAIKERLALAKNVVLASHVRPDGDAIGSLLGMGLALQNAGKSVQMALVDGVPASFRYLEGSEFIVKEPNGEHDTFITVDCADFKRVGKFFENFGQPDINIDHHKTNENFGKLNLIEAEEVATAAILTKRLPEWGFPITKPIAAALLTGDTAPDTIQAINACHLAVLHKPLKPAKLRAFLSHRLAGGDGNPSGLPLRHTLGQ